MKDLEQMRMKIFRIIVVIFLAVLPTMMLAGGKKHSFEVGEKNFLLDGKPFVVKAAEVHYPRIPRPYWEHRIKMCKALGMNTLCLYVFWNIHEQREGVFDFTGNNDVAEFCRLAQKHGMYVIVRPGPYVCAEWEMGGLPWWLLKKKDIRLREKDEYFMERVRIFEKEVGRQLSSLTIENGGPIIMVQVENEYGSYGIDKDYVSSIRDIVRESGFDKVTLFQCDWSSNFTNNGLDDLVWTMNFGTGADINEQFKRLGELRPDAPKMCSEFWSGWFDKWGARHETRPATEMVAGIDEMLSKDISFSLYMTHGGTSFSHWAGANSPGFAPDVTSYDYDAPITEWGTTTEKYFLLRDVMAKYNGGKALSAIPEAKPIISVPEFTLNEFAPLACGVDKSVRSHDILSMEDMDMGWGSMIYSTEMPQLPAGSTLEINEPHDFAQVFISDKYVGSINRVKNERNLTLPEVEEGETMTIIVESMGRINFGRAIKDYKGITESVLVHANIADSDTTYNLKDWIISTIPDDYDTAKRALAKSAEDVVALTSEGVLPAGYYRGYFNVNKIGDTFLNFETFGKGEVYVNGQALGRIWSIGPQQTLYVPGCWLKKGRNEVIVLDVVGPDKAVSFGQDTPELNKLNINKGKNTSDEWILPNSVAKHSLNLAAGNGWQTVDFGTLFSGRYLAIECLATHDSSDVVSIAEIYAIGADGKRLSREDWTVKYVSSEDISVGNKTADKVYDLQESTYWSSSADKTLPQVLVIDMGECRDLRGIEYLPRAEKGAPGSLKSGVVYVY